MVHHSLLKRLFFSRGVYVRWVVGFRGGGWADVWTGRVTYGRGPMQRVLKEILNIMYSYCGGCIAPVIAAANGLFFRSLSLKSLILLVYASIVIASTNQYGIVMC